MHIFRNDEQDGLESINMNKRSISSISSSKSNDTGYIHSIEIQYKSRHYIYANCCTCEGIVNYVDKASSWRVTSHLESNFI